MDIGIISVRYARALLKYAMEQQAEDKVYEELRVLSQTFLDVPQLRVTLENPVLGDTEKQQLLIEAAGGKVDECLKQFLALVINHHRTAMMQFIVQSYITLYREAKHIIHSRLIVASAVSEATMQKMKSLVESKSKSKVDFDVTTDPSIVGGFVLEYDTYRLNASMQSQLRRMRSQLIEN